MSVGLYQSLAIMKSVLSNNGSVFSVLSLVLMFHDGSIRLCTATMFFGTLRGCLDTLEKRTKTVFFLRGGIFLEQLEALESLSQATWSLVETYLEPKKCLVRMFASVVVIRSVLLFE